MKTLFSFGMAAFVLGFIFSADLLAEAEWEKKLKADGWVKVKEKLTTFADTTWYALGLTGAGTKKAWFFYISPDGKEAFYRNPKSGASDKGVRRQREDGLICMKWTVRSIYGERCFSHWKKGQVIRLYRDMGIAVTTSYTMKQGNTENL